MPKSSTARCTPSATRDLRISFFAFPERFFYKPVSAPRLLQSLPRLLAHSDRDASRRFSGRFYEGRSYGFHVRSRGIIAGGMRYRGRMPQNRVCSQPCRAARRNMKWVLEPDYELELAEGTWESPVDQENGHGFPAVGRMRLSVEAACAPAHIAGDPSGMDRKGNGFL